MNLLLAFFLLPQFGGDHTAAAAPASAPVTQVRMVHRTGRFWRVESYRNRLAPAARAEAAPTRTERPKAGVRQFRFR